MCEMIHVLLLCLINLEFLKLSAAQLASNYTREFESSLIFSYNQIDNKLERHEHRERALGEVIKKSLLSLQRGQENLKQLYDPQTSLDGRINQIEILLKSQEDRSIRRIESFFMEQKEINQQLLEKIMKLSVNVENLLHNSNSMVRPSTEAQSKNLYSALFQSSVAQVAPVGTLVYRNNTAMQVDKKYLYIPGFHKQSKPQKSLTYADKEFIQGLANETQNLVETQAETEASTKEVDSSLYADIGSILRRFNTQEDLMQRVYNQMNTSFIKINDCVENLSRCNSISQPLFQAMDTEASINNIIHKQHEQLLDFLKTRFDTVDKNIINIQFEIAKNLNATLQNEATYLWRQISITNGEINNSKDLLRLMRDRNDIYVNSVLQSMASMSNKVEDIKERVRDVNDNQTYILNKLPLMPQEFSDMQKAFIGWLEQLSETLKIMQEKKKVPTS